MSLYRTLYFRRTVYFKGVNPTTYIYVIEEIISLIVYYSINGKKNPRNLGLFQHCMIVFD